MTSREKNSIFFRRRGDRRGHSALAHGRYSACLHTRVFFYILVSMLSYIGTLGASAIVSAAPGQGLLHVQEGTAALLRGQYEKAITLYNKALADPQLSEQRRANLYNDLGVAQWRLSEYKQSLSAFNKAIKLYPEYASAYNNRGNVLLEMNHLEEAVKDFDRAILLSPAYGEAYNNRANAYLKKGAYQSAIADYQRAMERLPVNAVPYNGRGKSHFLEGRKFAALRDLSHAVRLNAKYPTALLNRAKAHLDAKKYKKAISDLSSALDLATEKGELYFLRGKAYSLENKNISAVKDFTKAIAEQPEYAEAYYHRGLSYLKLKEVKEAFNDFSHAIELNPDDAEAYARRGDAHLKMGLPDEAESDAQKAIKLAPENAAGYLVRAKFSESIMLEDKAVEDYRKALQFEPELNEAKKALKRLTGEEFLQEDKDQVVGEELNGWVIKKSAKTAQPFYAYNAKYKKLKVPLELYGDVAPKLLEWSALKKRFRGIGLLRYYAGQVPGKKNQRMEYIAILNLRKKQVVAIEPFLWGNKKANWAWKSLSVKVTDPAGLSHEVKLKRPAPKRRVIADSEWWYDEGPRWSNRGSSRRQRQRRRRRQQNIFNYLFR